MDLKRYTHNLIYEGKDMPLSDNLARFKIVGSSTLAQP